MARNSREDRVLKDISNSMGHQLGKNKNLDSTVSMPSDITMDSEFMEAHTKLGEANLRDPSHSELKYNNGPTNGRPLEDPNREMGSVPIDPLLTSARALKRGEVAQMMKEWRSKSSQLKEKCNAPCPVKD